MLHCREPWGEKTNGLGARLAPVAAAVMGCAAQTLGVSFRKERHGERFRLPASDFQSWGFQDSNGFADSGACLLSIRGDEFGRVSLAPSSPVTCIRVPLAAPCGGCCV